MNGMKRFIKPVLTVFAGLVALALTTYEIAGSRSFQFFGGIVNHTKTDRNIVALTFDDGPSDKTDEILAILSDLDVKATFFLVGQAMEQRLKDTADIIAAGHQPANHTYSHNRLIFRSLPYIADEIEKTDALIRAAGFQGDIQFRPPNGKKLLLLPYYLQKHNRRTILWDVEPNSYPEVNASAENITKYVMDHTEPGSIVLLHVMFDSKGTSIRAIKGIVEGLRGKGYEFVTINELLSYNDR